MPLGHTARAVLRSNRHDVTSWRLGPHQCHIVAVDGRRVGSLCACWSGRWEAMRLERAGSWRCWPLGGSGVAGRPGSGARTSRGVAGRAADGAAGDALAVQDRGDAALADAEAHSALVQAQPPVTVGGRHGSFVQVTAWAAHYDALGGE